MVCTAYGPPEVLQLREIPTPTPKPDEVLVRIRATTVTAPDCELRRFEFPAWIWLPLRLWFGVTKPRRGILGQELAGEVAAAGPAVRAFRAGDRVFAAPGVNLGAHAEFICLKEQPSEGALALMPAGLRFEEAAAVPYGGREALQFLRKGRVGPGQKVLVNGAGGSMGTYAVQLAKVFGAEVTAVDASEKLEMLRTIGADQVVDYRREDFTRNGKSYDVIFDVPGKADLASGLSSLRPGGRYLMANPRASHLLRALPGSRRGGKTVIIGAAAANNQDLAYLRDLIEAGKVRPVIDRTYPLEQTAEAHRYVETGRKQGSVVISC
jgi:NADPH:quinone reductase-like Zn-dependent oxidoreductase